ncbi:MAG: hypothetical protein Q7R49_01125 [Candidatus Daviesbacteria bacterium]|nr:hypothetical protein [Candidatus Daviesbacteria bacterium]
MAERPFEAKITSEEASALLHRISSKDEDAYNVIKDAGAGPVTKGVSELERARYLGMVEMAAVFAGIISPAELLEQASKSRLGIEFNRGDKLISEIAQALRG